MPRPFFDEFGFGMESNDFTAVWKGATDDATPVTYTVQSGVTWKFGPAVGFCINLTTTSLTKHTPGDAMQVNLPFAAANLPFTTHNIPVRVLMTNSNGGSFVHANAGVILKNTSLVKLQLDSPSAALADFTYTTLGCTADVAYTNTVTVQISGDYLAVSNAG